MLSQSRTGTNTRLAAAAPPGAQLLLAWYDCHARVLPWRALPGREVDPYAVWLSEIMLQQTGVKTVGPYYQRFLARWPNVAALAAADIGEVMQQWAGLGYYSRARSLHACAAKVVVDFGGKFPPDEAALLTLPGIGPYTAAAIAAIAFGQPAVVVDSNVERVVARLFAIGEGMPLAKPLIRQATASLTPLLRAGDFAQAMMDLGATICTPRRPACALCPLAADCAARKAGTMEDFPRKAVKAARPARRGAVFYLRRADGMVLVQKRPPRGLLGGMTEFPGTEWSVGFEENTARAPLTVALKRLAGEVEHVFTHFSLALAVFAGEAGVQAKAPDGAFWAKESELETLALPTLMVKVAAKAQGKA